MGLKESLESVNMSAAQLAEVLDAAKQSGDERIYEAELARIEAVLGSFMSEFSLTSDKAIKDARGGRGEVAAARELTEEIAVQYQAMESLVANMAETLLRLEAVRDRFEEISGGVESFLQRLDKSQQGPGAARVNLTRLSIIKTQSELAQRTESFRAQLGEQMDIYENLGAQYFQLMPAIGFAGHTHTTTSNPDGNGNGDGDGGDAGENNGPPDAPEGGEHGGEGDSGEQEENSLAPEDHETQTGGTSAGEIPEEEEQQQGTSVPLGGVPMNHGGGAAAAAPESHAAAPQGHQFSIHMAAPTPSSAAASAADPAPEQPTATQRMDALDRGRMEVGAKKLGTKT